MRKHMIDSYLRKLITSFGAVRRPIDDGELLKYFTAEDYTRMVGFIKKSMRIECRVRLGLVNSGGLSAPAWVEMPNPTPLAGTQAFRNMLATVFVRKDFITEVTFETLTYAMAHEHAHIVLNSTHHELRHEEVAVDLTCMLLGYRDFYVTGCQIVKQDETTELFSQTKSLFTKLFGSPGLSSVETTTSRLGYLARNEVHYAAHRMTTGL